MWGHWGVYAASRDTDLRRSRRLPILLAALVAVALTLALASVAHATDPGYGWQSGPLVESQDANCITADVEQEAGAYMSYYFDPSTPPVAGSTYYVAINVTGIGNTCAGIYADVELNLPSGTSLAIDSTHPVECFLQFPGASHYVSDAGNCPVSLSTGEYGYSLDPTNANPPFWPLPQGGTVEVNVPIKSAAGVNKITGVVQLADGEFNPVLEPYIDTIVDSPAQQTSSSEISVSYNSPSVTSQVQPGGAGTPVSVDTLGYAWNQSAVGTAYAQLAYPTAPGSTTTPANNCDSPYNNGTGTYSGYDYQTGAVSLKNPDTSITGSPYTFTGLYPGVPYCWRIVTVVTSPAAAAGTYYGNWQFFETMGTAISAGPYALHTITPLGTSDCSTSGAGCVTSACSGTGSCTTCSASCAIGFSSALTLPPASTSTSSTPSTSPPPTPAVTSPSQTHDTWREGNALAQISKKTKAKGPPVGTTFSFTLNEAASVTFSFNHSVKGRTVKGKCVAKTKHNSRKKSCAYTATAGTLSFTGHSGTNTVVFDGRVSASDKLKPGHYTLVISATNAQALSSTPTSLSFTIKK
ncbi:MAG: hypothetical protein ABSG64_00120 [Solirubrobacteraceae bacterium]|jgi:hypothetical protein